MKNTNAVDVKVQAVSPVLISAKAGKDIKVKRKNEIILKSFVFIL